jgi:crotonobetainyl-CoA:carnitine CoA-transferase CaiB-like acyl-CoA transferase
MKNEQKKTLPLQDIKILDLTRLIPGAVCTCMLGDAGAEIIKVEDPDTGDYERQIHPFIGPMASRFLILNRNKKSITLNLKRREGHEIFLEMVKEADVLLEGFRPGAMKKLGLDYESIKHINTRLIYCSISSFGQNGPYRDVVAHDITILGMVGFLDVTGVKGGAPIIPGIQIADSVAGTNAALAILFALMARAKTGKGQTIDISMFDGVMSWMFDAARYSFAGEGVPKRGEGRLWGGLPNYNLYETRDEKFIAVGSLESKFKKILLKKLGRDDLAEEEDEITSTKVTKTDEELHVLMKDMFLAKTRDEWMKEFEELNICVGPVNSLEEALSHPQAVFREMVLEVEHPSAGRIKQIGSALKFSYSHLDANRLPAPRQGEHTREILGELGYSEKSINDLILKNIVQEYRKS